MSHPPTQPAPSTPDTGDEQDVVAYTRYEWDCPCGEVNDEPADPAGETVTCDSCHGVFICRETR